MDLNKLNISGIRQLIKEKPLDELPDILELIELDKRKGVQSLKGVILTRFKVHNDRIKKKEILLSEEGNLWDMGYRRIGGMDEAGRGPLAGPVVAACVVFGVNTYIEGIDDSKKLSPANRERLFDIIMEKAEFVGVGRVDSKEIDRINILNATKNAMIKAASQCYGNMDFLLIDAMNLPLSVPYKSLIKGDELSHSIAAASIIAKVTRDREMLLWHGKYPDYGFDKHKGYGTKAHIDAIEKFGLCPIHRATFTHKFVR